MRGYRSYRTGQVGADGGTKGVQNVIWLRTAPRYDRRTSPTLNRSRLERFCVALFEILIFAFFGGSVLSNSARVYGHSFILRQNVQALVQQMEELQRLRNQVRWAEARLGVRRYKCTIPRERLALSKRAPTITIG